MRLGLNIRGFFDWWFGELAGLVPRRLRRIFARGVRILLFDLSQDELVLRHYRGERCQILGRIDLAGLGAAAQSESVRALVGKVNLRTIEVAARLPASQGLRKAIELPSAAEPDLRQTLFFQIGYKTPFTPEEVHFDYRISERQPKAKRLTVELTVVPKSAVESAFNSLAKWGIEPTIVDVAEDDPDAPPRLNVLSDGEHALPSKTWSPPDLVLAGLALVLLATAVYIPLERQRATAEALAAEVVEARSEAEEAARLRGELQELIHNINVPREQKRQSPSVLGILNELTRLFPDDTWLLELRISGGEVSVSGNSSAASKLIGLIDDSPMFQEPHFRSPVTRDASTGLERFSVSFEVGGEGPS